MSTKTALNKAIRLVGLIDLAKGLGISYQSISRWQLINRMPDTEYSCRTNHAIKIEKLTGGEVTVSDLLGHVPTCVAIKRDK